MWDSIYALAYWDGFKTVVSNSGRRPNEEERVLLAKSAKERADDAYIAHERMLLEER